MKTITAEQLTAEGPDAGARRAARRTYERRRSAERFLRADRDRRRQAPLREDYIREIAARVRSALHRSRGVVARLQEAEACLLVRAKQQGIEAQAGHVRFRDFASEVLRIHPRSVTRRIALLDVLDRHPALREAFRAGDLSASQALALAPVVTPENAVEWLGRAQGLSVQVLRERVRRALGPRDARARDTRGDPRVCIAWSGPKIAGLAFEHGLETTRRVLGWDAPKGACLAAILAEAESSLPDETPGGKHEDRPIQEPGCCRREGEPTGHAGPHPEPGKRRMRRGEEPDIYCSTTQLRTLRKLLRRYERRLAHAERVMARIGDAPPEPYLAIFLEAWKALQALSRPLYVLETRLLVHVHAAMGAESLGHENVVRFVVREKRVSDRTARTLLFHGRVFECLPLFRQAFIQGGLGKCQIDLLNRSVLNFSPAWLDRAARLTQRQLAWEVRLLHRLAGIDADVFSPVLIPDWGYAEDLLRRRLFWFGFSPDALDRDLDARGLLGPPGASRDPAMNPLVLSRIEVLLDLLVLAQEDCFSDPDGGSAGQGGDDRKTVSPHRRHRVRIWAEAHVHDHWHRLLARLRRARGWVPAWAAAVLLFNAAVTTWQEIHREWKPTEHRILERDGYRCRAPGCSARRGLEVHHIDYRSHQGSEEPWNKITLCAPHHRHAVHTGWLRIRGRAPHDLSWTLGDDRRWVYLGDRLRRRA